MKFIPDTTSKHAIAVVNKFKQRAHVGWLYQRNNLLGMLRKPEKKLIIHELGASNLRAFLSIAFIKQLLVDASSFTRKHDTF